MKKIILISFNIMLWSVSIQAQITLDTIVSPPLGIGYDFYTVQISKTETKYYFADTTANSFSLYNMDFTPFLLNILVPEPFAQTSNAPMQALFITRTLFDCDSSNIEYAFYSTLNNNKPFKILRTDGTILFQIDSALGPYCHGGCLGWSDVIVPIRNTSDGAKLFLNKYNYSTNTQSIYIYSLCDSLPLDVFDFRQSERSIIKIFPNPNSGLVSFQIDLPDNVNEYELAIFDGMSKEIQRKKINSWNKDYIVDINDFSSGTYFYVLQTRSSICQSGKFLLTK